MSSVEKQTMPEDPLARAAEQIAQQLAGTLTVALAQVIQCALSNGEFSAMRDRVEKLETGLQNSTGMLEETQRSIEKRLDSQAAAIRTLLGSIHERSQQMNTLLDTLHRLQETGAAATQPRIPDDL